MVVTLMELHAIAILFSDVQSASSRDVIDRAFDTFFTCTMGAAIDRALRFDAMTDDLASAMGADWRKLVDRAFKGVKNVA